MDRIIIYRLGSLGDTVAALPSFHLIERAFPDAERLVLTNVPVSTKAAPLASILEKGGLIHGAIPYPVGMRDPRGLARLARELRARQAHTLVYLAASRGLHTAWRDLAFFKLCGFRRIVGVPTTRSLQENHEAPDGTVEHECRRLVRTIAVLGDGEVDARRNWDLRLTEAERQAAAAALAPLSDVPGFIAVHTGGKAVEKDWGEPRWAALLELLGQRYSGFGLVFLGAPDDVERSVRLSRNWTSGPALDLAGVLTARESAAALALADLFVGHDSGPLHLSDAVGTPSVGLFGDYNRPNKWHPIGRTTSVIHQMAGLDFIAPEDVVRAARDVSARAS